MKSIPDHELDAFVDGELDQSDRSNVLGEMARSGELANKVADTQRLKDLIRLAYEDEKPRKLGSATSSKTHLTHAVAAFVGAVSMLVVMQVFKIPTTIESSAQNHQVADVADNEGYFSHEPQKPEQVLFHLSSSDRQTAQELLNQVELVASQYAKSNRELRIFVITNNEGLRIFQTRYTENAERIRDIYTRHNNIVFAACGTTLGNQIAMGEKAELLPEVIVVDSGVAEITRRQFEGWKYIRI